MFSTLASVAIGFILVLSTVGIAFVFGLALQQIAKFLIEEMPVSILGRTSTHPPELADIAVTGILVTALVFSPMFFLLAFDRVWGWLVRVLV